MSEKPAAPIAELLVVDDTPETVLLLTQLLKKKGYRVRVAENGLDALAAAEAAVPDLILLDVMMPDMDGYAVCQTLRQMPSMTGVPILFVSANDDTRDKLKAFQAGGLDYITKPFQASEVLARVETHLALRRTRQELEVANERLRTSLTDNTRLLREVQRLAEIDSLTNVANRGRFFSLAEYEFSSSQRYKRPLAMIMLDIDHFKRVNDTYGHAAGDDVLRQVAKAAQAGLRDCDIIGRYGGEEFAICLPTAELDSALLVAERLHQRVASCAITTPTGPIQVTISLGVADTLPSDQQVDQPLARADQALYTAKRTGRNRVAAYQPET